MKHSTFLLLGLFVPCTLVCGLSTRAAETPGQQTVTILGNTYAVVPDEEFRALGFEFPDVAPDENAATDYLTAFEAYVPPQRGSEEYKLRNAVISGQWIDEFGLVAVYLERNAGVLKLIKQAAAKPKCHFPVMVGSGETLDGASVAGILLPQLAHMRELARLAVAEGKAREHEGRVADALDAYLLALQIGNHTAQDSTLIGGLVGIACSSIGLQAIEQCLVRCEIDEAVLAMVQERVHELSKDRPSVAAAMRSERAFSTNIIEYTITHTKYLTGLGQDTAFGQATMLLMLRSEEGQAQIRRDVREFWDATDKAMELPLPEYISTDADEELVRKAKARKFPPNVMALLGPAVGRARFIYAHNELHWTVLDVEFALARSKAEHGTYPKTLEELKPRMLSDGVDPYSGESLQYRREADGSFTLWSVGEDLEDDGGIPTKGRRWNQADFVWSSALPEDAE